MDRDYGAMAVEGTLSKGLQRVSLRKRLEMRRKDAQEHLDKVEKAISFLDENPNLEKYQDIMGDLGI
jgi:hypothetical protein